MALQKDEESDPVSEDGNIRIAVVIVNYDSGPLLQRCLESIAAQTRAPCSVIVVDNCSRDGSEAVAEAFPGVLLLRQPRNLGFAAANNRGIAAATDCDWVATLNPDATASPDWIAALRSAVSRYPDCDSFACCLLDGADPSRMDGAGDAYHLSGLPWRHLHGASADAAPHAVTEVFGACAAGAMYRRAVLGACGGFDEDLFCYVEDVDIAFRIRLLGGRCLYLPEARVHHLGSATVGRGSAFQIYHGHRNLVWVFVKNMPGALLWLLLPLHLLLNIVSLVWFSARGSASAVWAAKRDALKGLPAVWRKRRRVQVERRIGAMAVLRILTVRWPGSRRRMRT